MPKNNQPGGSMEESLSTKPRKRTTKKTAKKPTRKTKSILQDEAQLQAQKYWDLVKDKVLERTVGTRGINQVIRASNPRAPEDKDWWDKAGPELVSHWIRFREHGNWQVAMIKDLQTNEMQPAVELELSVDVGDTYIKMAIDRIMIDSSGNLCIVDLKTGKRTPASSLQLAFYRYGIKKTYGIEINTGYYWMARSAVMSDPIDLSDYTDEKIEYLVTTFDRARKAATYIPNTSNCGMCGYTMHCIWYQGDKK